MARGLKVLSEAVGCCSPVTHLRAKGLRPFVDVFKALADETRLEILGLLGGAGRALCACDIEQHFDLSQPTISHHLKILRNAGLVRSEKQGTWVYFELNRETLSALDEFRKSLGP